MQNFREYNYTIQIDKLEETVKKVIEYGYPVIVMINGEYYNIGLNDSGSAARDRRTAK